MADSSSPGATEGPRDDRPQPTLLGLTSLSRRERTEQDGHVWYRHVEFQAQKDTGLPRRCFEYNSRLILHYGAAVLTTVLYLLPGADEDVPDAFRLYVGDWLVYEWRFDVVRLWEIDAQDALRSGEAGPLALVPLLRGGDEPSKGARGGAKARRDAQASGRGRDVGAARLRRPALW